jgi:MtN3 and saliva related transmembrane protein
VERTYIDRSRFSGVCGTDMTTCAFWPQLQKTWTSKSAGDVSLSMLAILSCGVCLWFMYGLVLQAWPIILTNSSRYF